MRGLWVWSIPGQVTKIPHATWCGQKKNKTKKTWLETLKEYIFCIISFSELIKTADGGQISLDWFDNDNSKHYMDASTRPTVLLLPGLTGTSKESYILHMIHLSEELGYRYPWMISFIFHLIHFKWGFAMSNMFVSEILVISSMD